MTKKDQAKCIYEVVNGSATNASQLNLMAQGSNPRYKKLYAQLAVEPNTDPTSNTLIERSIHSFYSPNHNTRTLSTGKDNEICLQFISRLTLNNHKLIDAPYYGTGIQIDLNLASLNSKKQHAHQPQY